MAQVALVLHIIALASPKAFKDLQNMSCILFLDLGHIPNLLLDKFFFCLFVLLTLAFKYL